MMFKDQSRFPAIRGNTPSVRGGPVTPPRDLPEKPEPRIIGSGFGDYVPDLELWIPIKEAGKIYNIPHQTLYQWAKRGQILATQGDYGNRENVWHIDRKSLEKVARERYSYGK